ncbi:hypothetical protein AKO1_013271 [Acrasis kona]|uniref:PH domain-containing protein n=1 Tax=Acrasis kona TaxID=1008807 RepID=A0AAW2YY02_9EUKA
MYNLVRKKKQHEKHSKTIIKGGKFIKHGRKGKPHERFVSANSALDTLTWREVSKANGRKNSFPMESFIDVKKGADSKVLLRSKSKVDHTTCLYLVGTTRTLDLQTNSETERDEWYEVFSSIIDNEQAKKNDDRYHEQQDIIARILKTLSTFTFDVESSTWKISKVLTKNAKFTDQDITNCAMSLDGNTVLTHLDLSGIGLSDYGLNQISTYLCPNLVTLVLSDNDFGDDGFIVFAAALIECKHLKTLDFSNNNISDRGIDALEKPLSDNKSVTELILDKNDLGDEGAMVFCDILKTNKTLKTLSLNYNQISSEGAKRLAVALENKNNGLENLMLARNAIVFPTINHDDPNRDQELEVQLFLAVNSNNYAQTILLSLKGCDPNVQNEEDGRTPLHVSAMRGNMPMIELLMDHPSIDYDLRDDQGCTPIYLAAENLKYDIVKMFLEKNVDSKIGNNNKKTILHLFAEQGNKVLIKMLIEQYHHDLNSTTTDELTPLHLASQNLRRPVIEYLLQKDEEERKEFFQKNTRDDDIDPDEVIAYVNWQDSLGETCLHKVFNNKTVDMDCAKLLVQRGADVSLTDNKGRTPIDNADAATKELLLNESRKAMAQRPM